MKLDRKKFELAKARACMGSKELEEAGLSKGTLCRAMGGNECRPETIGKLAKSSCEQVDAFVILTKQGVVLASDDTKLTVLKDSYLYNLNQELIKRKDMEWDEIIHTRPAESN